jgi:uncharacterized protein YecE (DUF72 family)
MRTLGNASFLDNNTRAWTHSVSNLKKIVFLLLQFSPVFLFTFDNFALPENFVDLVQELSNRIVGGVNFQTSIRSIASSRRSSFTRAFAERYRAFAERGFIPRARAQSRIADP